MSDVRDGRLSTCSSCRDRKYCAGCEQVIRYGEPKPTDSWVALRLDENDLRMLSVGAAEFDRFHRRYVARARKFGLPIPPTPTAVDFADWVRGCLTPRQDYEWEGLSGRDSELPQAGRMTRDAA